MELIIILVIIVAIGYILYNQINKEPESTSQSAVPEVAPVVTPEPAVEAKIHTVKEVAKKTTARVKKALDVNQDGKVNAQDAVAAVKKVAAKTAKPKTVKK